jgi:hypothetical protein
MKIYDRPAFYFFTHLLMGFAAAWYPIIGILAILYQLGQLAFNVRVFARELKILKGNSVAHTFVKLMEIGLGYLLGSVVKKLI